MTLYMRHFMPISLTALGYSSAKILIRQPTGVGDKSDCVCLLKEGSYDLVKLFLWWYTNFRGTLEKRNYRAL